MKLQSAETTKLKDAFIKIDASKDGVLTLDEIRKGMRETLNGIDTKGFNWKELFDEIDTDGSGAIDYGEFVTAAVNKQAMLSSENIDMMFKLYDKDGDGEITATEFKDVFRSAQAFQEGEEDEIWKQILEEVDENDDGQISMAEFKKAMGSVLAKRAESRKSHRSEGETKNQ